MSDSIGGTAKTLMFVNVSPVDANLDETQNSLQVGGLGMIGCCPTGQGCPQVPVRLPIAHPS